MIPAYIPLAERNSSFEPTTILNNNVILNEISLTYVIRLLLCKPGSCSWLSQRVPRRVMATKVSSSSSMMWKPESKCLHDALSEAVCMLKVGRAGNTLLFYYTAPRACKSRVRGARCGQVCYVEVLSNAERCAWILHEEIPAPCAVCARDQCVYFAKLQVATANLHRPLLAPRFFRCTSRNTSSREEIRSMQIATCFSVYS